MARRIGFATPFLGASLGIALALGASLAGGAAAGPPEPAAGASMRPPGVDEPAPTVLELTLGTLEEPAGEPTEEPEEGPRGAPGGEATEEPTEEFTEQPGEDAPGALLLLVIEGQDLSFDTARPFCGLELSWRPPHWDLRRPGMAPGGDDRMRCVLGLFESGTYRLEGLPEGVPFELSVQDLEGATLWSATEAPLEAGEPRRLEARVPAARTLALRVVGPGGEPAAGGHALVVLPRGQRELRALATGVFPPHELRAGRIGVLVSARGLAARTLRDLAVPLEGLELEIALDAGRPLAVEVRGAGGERVESTRVLALQELGGELAFQGLSGRALLGDGQRVEPGLFRFEGLSREPLEVLVLGEGHALLRTIDGTQEHLLVELPPHGGLELTFGAGIGPGQRLGFELIALEGAEQALPLRESLRSDREGQLPPLGFPHVPAGKYELRLLRGRDLLRAQRLEIRAGETLELELEPTPAPPDDEESPG